MKTIGLIGGTSWVSTIDYYRIINQAVNDRLGGNESAKILLYSVNYGEIVTLTKQGDWDSINQIISAAAKKLQAAGADCLLLCANTMHIIAEKVQSAVGLPLIHIADVVSAGVHKQGARKVLLLGTRYTMHAGFYKDYLSRKGITVSIPPAADIDIVNDTIYNEMGKGQFLPSTKQYYLDLIAQEALKGSEAVILGCTEIPMLLNGEQSAIPMFDTLLLHATASVDFALKP